MFVCLQSDLHLCPGEMGKKAHNNTALVRLRRDYMRLKTDPVPYITAEPLPSNILEWYVFLAFISRGNIVAGNYDNYMY